MKTGNTTVGARLRIVFESGVAFGPGKADLLEAIKETGSIAAAGRRMAMSYKRAWLLVAAMNRCFRNPLVVASRGGQAHGGAELTAEGEKVLACYRRMEAQTADAIRNDMAQLVRMLNDISGRK